METRELRKAISQNLKKYRKMKGWTQFKLAERAEVSEQTVNSIEGLRLWPSDKILYKICSALEIEMYKLFIPQTISLQGEDLENIKQAAVRGVETFVHDALREWGKK